LRFNNELIYGMKLDLGKLHIFGLKRSRMISPLFVIRLLAGNFIFIKLHMRNFLLNIFFLLSILSISFPSFSQLEIWTVGTAKTIYQGNLEVNVLRPCRYGITKTLEVSAQPIAFPVFPNAQIKKNWYDREIAIATVHGINYPTLALNLQRKRNKEDWIPIDSVVPQLIVIKNEVIVSKMLKAATSCEAPNYYLSLKAGVQFALKFKESTLPLIEKPIIYQRTSVYYDQILWYVGADLDAHLNEIINYSVDLDFLSVGLGIDDWAIEHKGLLMTKLTKSLMIEGGYKLSYGTYPKGNQLKIYPLADVSWTYKFKKLKKDELQLFKDKKGY
jgi:hypothetical protein